VDDSLRWIVVSVRFRVITKKALLSYIRRTCPSTFFTTRFALVTRILLADEPTFTHSRIPLALLLSQRAHVTSRSFETLLNKTNY